MPLTVAVRIRAPVTVAPIAPVVTPFAFVAAAGCTIVFPLPVAAKVTGRPAITFPNPSRAVTVTVAGVFRDAATGVGATLTSV